MTNPVDRQKPPVLTNPVDRQKPSDLFWPILSRYKDHLTCPDQSFGQTKTTWPVLTNPVDRQKPPDLFWPILWTDKNHLTYSDQSCGQTKTTWPVLTNPMDRQKPSDLFWPILWALAAAWRSFWGLKSLSTKMTVSAAVRFNPWPPVNDKDKQVQYNTNLSVPLSKLHVCLLFRTCINKIFKICAQKLFFTHVQ